MDQIDSTLEVDNREVRAAQSKYVGKYSVISTSPGEFHVMAHCLSTSVAVSHLNCLKPQAWSFDFRVLERLLK